jgi:hypothetical protein
MSVLRQVFGPSKEEVWRKLASQIDGSFTKGGLLSGRDRVQVQVKEWTITLDTYVVSTGKSTVVFTRMRAPYLNKDGFRFTIYRRGVFTEIGKVLGMQDVEVGSPEFDHDFVIKGTNESKLRQLFSNPEIRRQIQAQPRIYLHVKDDEGWFGTDFPEGVDELHFQTVGVIKDIDRLKGLYELFAEVLNHLCHIGSAYEDDPKLVL